MNRLIVLFTFFLSFVLSSFGEHEYPHILVNSTDKDETLKKIEEQPWARFIFEEEYQKVKPYVERHQTDPEWILSRYLMNRIEGKRYTHAYDDGTGHYLVRYSGDAPVPTVRYSTHKRSPLTKKGSSYIKPSIEELVPYDTSMYIWALNPETGQKDYIDPQQLVSLINGDINDLALNAAVIYWLYGDEKFARFAADILNQWAQGASWQEPIVGACRTGFLDIQTLGDNRYQSLILAYDFVYPFLKKEGYELSWYQNVFEKFAATLTFRGFWNSNWYAAVSSTLVYAALSLEDKEKQDYYLQFVLERDTISGACGHLSLATTVRDWLTPDGHWKEPGGYHTFPVSNLVKATLALEKNGYPVFQQFPELFKATYVVLKYSFPNLLVSAFGDTGRTSQSPETLEIGIAVAFRHKRPELQGMMAAMSLLIERGMYDRSKTGIFGLLTFLPDFPETNSLPYQWPNSFSLDFARFFGQRNGMDEKWGLMYGVQGASYNHNHCNGMAMELYGCGEVMGIDAGTGPNYEHPLHQNYYSQWAAHNTVVAGGSSASVPFNGSAGEKDIGQVELASMEPLPGKVAVSVNYSYTDTRYFDRSTGTNQLRTMGIIRTSDSSGYYVDIYRSDNPASNDYIYHNIGEDFSFYDINGGKLEMVPEQYPLTEKDYPGFRFFTEVEKLNYSRKLKGIFSAHNSQGVEVYMHVFFPAARDKTYFRAKSLPVKTAGDFYKNKPLPLFTVRAEKEAWKEPFITVYEPSHSISSNSIVSVEKITGLCNENNTAIRIAHADGTQQIILQGNKPETTITGDKISFAGHFGVISLDRNNNLVRLYLGEGQHISYKKNCLSAVKGIVSAEVNIKKKKTYEVSGNNPVAFKVDGILMKETN